MSTPPLERIVAKIAWADQQIQDFQLGLSAFLETNPYQVTVEEKPEGETGRYYVSKIDPVPDTLAVIAASVIGNLRSALDNLAYQLVLTPRHGKRPDWKVYFPISNSASGYKGTRGGCIKGVGQAVIDTMDATEPYKGGQGHAFWQLNRLANIEKHEIPLGAAVYSRSVDISVDMEHSMRQFPGFEDIRIPPIFLNPAKKLTSLKVGHILFNGPSHPEVANKRQFRFDVSFDAPDVLKPEPAIKTLKDFSNLVRATIESFRPFV